VGPPLSNDLFDTRLGKRLPETLWRHTPIPLVKTGMAGSRPARTSRLRWNRTTSVRSTANDGITIHMRVATGKVVAGKVVVDGAPFEEGTSVTVIAADGAETFELGPEDEDALLAAIAEAERGELVDGAELLNNLRRRG